MTNGIQMSTAPAPKRRLMWPSLLCVWIAGGWGVAHAQTTAQAALGNPPTLAGSVTKFVEVPATAQLLSQLQAGGYTLYLRHGPTDNRIADRLPKVDLSDCRSQRPLTEAGRAVMARVGAGMRQASIPIGEFRVSPLCRARDSASAAFPKLQPEVDPLLMYVANFTAHEKAPVIENTRRWLSMPVPPGTNRLVLAHAPNLMELLGYFPKEGTLVILRPQGEANGFEYLASVAPDAWSGLLK